MFKLIAKWAWIGAIAWGLVLVGSGAFMFAQGRTAHNEVRDTLADEQIVSSADSDIPSVAVNSAATAKAQADAIRGHILAQTGGKTYAQLDSKIPAEAALRTTYLTSVTLRTALMEGYLSFKVADLVMGVGAIIAVLGLSHVVLGVYLGLFIVRPFARAEAAEAAASARPMAAPGGLGGA
jgi:hypothetical protein